MAAITREALVFHRIRISRGGMSPLRDVGYLAQIGSVIRAVRPDLLHNITVKPIVYGTIAARGLGVPRIVNAISGLGYAFCGGRSRQLLSGLVRAAYRASLGHHDIRVIFQNKDDVETFVNARIIDPAQAVLIRGSGIDLDAFSYSTEPWGTPRVVLPARMLRDKGIIEFAQAARWLRSQGCNAVFLLAGRTDKGNPASLWERDLLRLQLDTGVQWLGHVGGMPALLRDAHVVCLPSYREGLPKALMEACAVGRPIVTTDVPGCREAVANETNGLLVKPRNVEMLRDALGRLLSDPALRARMGVAGRRKAETEFDINTTVRATLELYLSMLD